MFTKSSCLEYISSPLFRALVFHYWLRAVCSVQYAVCSVQCVVCSVQCALCSVHAVCSVHYVACGRCCSVQYVLCKRDAGNAILNTWSKSAAANYTVSNGPTEFTLLSYLPDRDLKLPQQDEPQQRFRQAQLKT